MWPLDDERSLVGPAKIRNLALGVRAGLSVPPGWVCRCDDVPSDLELDRCLLRGPVIARSALVGEDESSAAAAGLSLSIADRRTVPGLREALREIGSHRRDRWLVGYRGPPRDGDLVLVQAFVPARWILVAVVEPDTEPYVEVHDSAIDPLARGTSPAYAGPLARWSETPSEAVGDLLDRTRRVEGLPAALDVEVVVDVTGRPHLVQARPLARPLEPGWEAFRQAVTEAGQLDALRSANLTLDAEHNPHPLSIAHAWLMTWLSAQRPQAGNPTILAGWLYVQTLPRALTARRSSPHVASPIAALRRLERELVPAARRRLARLERELETADRARTAHLLTPALDGFLTMIDAYLEVLVPARAGRKTLAHDPRHPLSTRERARFADVLPARWDIAAPFLGALSTFSDASPQAPELHDEGLAATLLTEWDDHLFALGLAGVRAVFVRAGELLGVGDDVFLLDGDELRGALGAPGTDDLVPTADTRDARRQRLERWSVLRPPLRIENGAPVPFLSRRHLSGLPIGPSHRGPIAQRTDLEHLLAAPPEPEAIVVLPALTAQAALAIDALGLRAVCCEFGGALSHAALMSRELGLSALVGCSGCTEVPDGTLAEIDVRTGRLRLEPPTVGSP